MSAPTRAALLSALSAAALLSLAGATSLAAHPTGKVDAKAAKKAGIAPDVTEVGCLDCHVAHGAPADNMVPQSAATEGCLTCHQRQASQRAGTGHPWDVPLRDSWAVRTLLADGYWLGPGDTVGCLSCHGVHEARPNEGSCSTCHRQQTPKRTRDDEGHSKQACLDCHVAHPGIGNHAGLRPVAGDPDGCASCHGAGKRAFVAGVEPGRLGHPVAGAKLASGEALTCRSCHDAHNPEVPESTSCLDCHEEQEPEWARGGHGDATCEDCHPVHERSPMEGVSIAGADLNPRSLACLGCHAERAAGDASKVESFDHESPVFDLTGQRWTPLGKLPLYAADGSELPRGANGELTCSSCHTTHGPETARTVDNLRRSGWEDACSSCHGDDALLLYRYFHKPSSRPKVEKR